MSATTPQTESKHTPGPWGIRKAIAGADFGITAKDGPHDILIGEAWFLVGERPGNVVIAAPVEANARLMAAAPHLKAALLNLMAAYGKVTRLGQPNLDPAWLDAKAAIDKAGSD